MNRLPVEAAFRDAIASALVKARGELAQGKI
jgi:hypothetical protein